MNRKKKIVLVTALGASLAIWNTVGLKWMVDREVEPVTAFFATGEIPGGTEITKEMLSAKPVPTEALPPNAITNVDDLLGKYVAHGYGVAENSMFYKEKVKEQGGMDNASVLKLKEGEYAFPLLVDLETSLGNGIVPDSKVDLAFRGYIEVPGEKEGTVIKKPMYGIIAQNVRVTAVKDANAGAVFEQQSDQEQAAEKPMSKMFTFAVNEELNELLNKAVLLGEIRPIAKGSEGQDTNLSTGEVTAFIKNSSFTAEDQQLTEPASTQTDSTQVSLQTN